MRIINSLLLLILFASCITQDKDVMTESIEYISAKAIYGEDNRYEVDDASKEIQKLSKVVFAKFYHEDLKSIDDNNFKINHRTIIDDGFCPEVRFAEQISTAKCSGFLVADDIIITAGHCVVSQQECDKMLWALDYSLETQHSNTLKKKNVFQCKEVLAQRLGKNFDYAVIQLEKKVSNREPLQVDFDSSGIRHDDTIFLIGYPFGLPAKVTDKGNILMNINNFFLSDIDALGGNSGSPVFNSRTHKVEGILVNGSTDHVLDDERKCKKMNYCTQAGSSEECNHEVAMKISAFNLNGLIDQSRRIEEIKTFSYYCNNPLYDSDSTHTIERLKIKYEINDCEQLLKKVSSLKRLYLIKQNIKSIKPLAYLTQIKKLNISSNLITNLHPLKNLKNLTHLSVSENPLINDDVHCPTGFSFPAEVRLNCILNR